VINDGGKRLVVDVWFLSSRVPQAGPLERQGVVSKAVYQQLLVEFREAWCNQSEGVPFQVEVFPSGEPSFDRDKFDMVARVALPRGDHSPDPDPNWYGFVAVVRNDDETASDREKGTRTARPAPLASGTTIPSGGRTRRR